MNKSLSRERYNWLLAATFVILIILSLSILALFIWAIMTSLKAPAEYDLFDNKLGFPNTVTFENYINAFRHFTVKVYDQRINNYRLFNIFAQFGNSFLYSVGCMIAQTFTPCVVAYIVARYRYKFLGIYYMIVLITMSLPIVGSLASELQLATVLGLYDSFWGLWIMKAHFLGLYFLIFYAQFKTIPYEFTESAKIDGASNFRTMVNVIMPLAWSTISTIMLLNFITYWNDYQIPMLYLPSYPVAAYGIFLFQSSQEQVLSYTPVKISGMLILSMPIIVIFLLFHDKLMVNLSIGGIKE